ncbi:MAG: hypothetical protein R3C28_04950 [Pirellulaceae bacterium]
MTIEYGPFTDVFNENAPIFPDQVGLPRSESDAMRILTERWTSTVPELERFSKFLLSEFTPAGLAHCDFDAYRNSRHHSWGIWVASQTGNENALVPVADSTPLVPNGFENAAPVILPEFVRMFHQVIFIKQSGRAGRDFTFPFRFIDMDTMGVEECDVRFLWICGELVLLGTNGVVYSFQTEQYVLLPIAPSLLAYLDLLVERRTINFSGDWDWGDQYPPGTIRTY